MRPLAETKGIQIHTIFDSISGSICGDPARLQQVVWNLLTNAIKFTPKGGDVEVRLLSLELALGEIKVTSASVPLCFYTSSYVQIQVIDTGVGISSDFLPKVFERFRQADSTTTRAHNGLGLGLAIVRHLVELHGGTIVAESPGQGQGATFTVRLPLMPQENQTSRSSEAVGEENSPISSFGDLSAPLTGLKVLVVDDEIDSRNFLAFMFEEYGAVATAVGSVDAALAVLEQLKPDILISDIGMSEQDGYTLIAKLRSLEPEKGGNIPAIALTAYSREEDRLQALSAGFQQHLSKPIDPSKLIAVVANVLKLPLTLPISLSS